MKSQWIWLGTVALLIEETKNRAESQIKSNAGFWRREKPEYPGKNLSQQIRELTNSVHIYDGGSGNPNTVLHIGGRLLKYSFQDHPNILTNWILH